jgi:hypothetical protein
MNANAPTFVPLSDAKSSSGDHTQDIKHHGKPSADRQPPKKHHNKHRSNRGKGNRLQHHNHHPQRTEKAPSRLSDIISTQEDRITVRL